MKDQGRPSTGKSSRGNGSSARILMDVGSQAAGGDQKGGGIEGPSRYRAYTLHNYLRLPQIQQLSDEDRFAIEVVGRVLPFKTNSYVVEELIDWQRVPDDPIFVLNFPRQNMLPPRHFDEMAALLKGGAAKDQVDAAADRIRLQLNPHPAGQLEHNVPAIAGEKLEGMQHKYGETVLFFPTNGQTCHAYCTFCFRWPQFVGMDGLKFATQETEQLVAYLRCHEEVTDILFTGGDPMVMRTPILSRYIRPLLEERPGSLQTIRIGTKSLGYWPYRFLTDSDAEDVLALFREVVEAGFHLSIMAHFNHPQELYTTSVREAIGRIRETGAQIRTQSPLMRNINDSGQVWRDMWRDQVRLGCVPYYMFVARDTGAEAYFNVPLLRAWDIFREAYTSVSGLGRTVRGPSMSADPGKVEVLGPAEIRGEKVIALRMIQGRNPNWAMRPFFAAYDEEATWLSDLRPAFGEEKFFFEEELGGWYRESQKEGRDLSESLAATA